MTSASTNQVEEGGLIPTVPLHIRPISVEQARPFIENIHYARRWGSREFLYGLYEDGTLVGVIAFGPPSSPQVARSVFDGPSKVVKELSRLVITSPLRNAASKLVGIALRLLPPPWVVVSYADEGQGHKGYVYQACGFRYAGLHSPHDAEYIVDGKRVHPRTLAARGIKDPVQWARENGVCRVPIEPKHRYVKWKGVDESRIKWASQPYPKGTSKRYDAPNKERVSK